MREQMGLQLDERDYAKNPFTAGELVEIFKGRDAREFLNPKSPAFKAKGLDPNKLTADQALKLIAEDSRLMKRPLVIAGSRYIAGFDRDKLRKSLS